MPRSEMSRREVCRIRLAAQFLATSGGRSASDVVAALGAVQAQDFLGAKWALSQRTGGLTAADIERGFADGRILRTHVLRPTWHFVVPEDIRWMLALTGPRVAAAMAYYNRTLELTPAVFRRSNTAIARALVRGKYLTRAELAAVLRRARIGEIGTQRLAHLMMQAELDGVVCSGPRRGKQFTYALLDGRVPHVPVRHRDESLLDLTHRYFSTRGPATARDFAWWSGLSLADVRRGIQIAGRGLEAVSVRGQPCWIAIDTPRPGRLSPRAHLLPNYDEYFIGLKDRSAIGERLGSVILVEGGSALTAHLVFVDGQLVGGWKRIVEKGSTIVRLKLLTRLTWQERRRVASAAGSFGQFLGEQIRIEEERTRLAL